MMDPFKKSEEIDIMIIAEGTFPYIKGGVSTWIYQLITGLEEFTFGIIFIGSRPEDYGDSAYEIPNNLVFFDKSFIFDTTSYPKPKKIRGNKNDLKIVNELHQWLINHKGTLPDKAKTVDFYIKDITEEKFLYSKIFFNRMVEMYSLKANDIPFIDYIWTIRNSHAAIWKLTKIGTKLPKVKLFHSPSTGYAGFLGSILKYTYNNPFILTEHGIYTRERKIDLLTAEWIKYHKPLLLREVTEENYLKKVWINFFESLSYFTYHAADKIISLFNGARNVQIEYGADKIKTEVIPNGVDVDRLKKISNIKREKNIITLIGRVVQIKDIKTFIRSIRILSNKITDVEAWIVGPEDEDPEYVKECKDMVKTLSLENTVKFLGFQKVDDILSKTKILTLTSISEGMPLVILEAFAAGVPVVATDVGSCRELIYGGMDNEDIKLGHAGVITKIANPSELADAYEKLLLDEEKWNNFRNVALKRVNRYYSQKLFYDSYRRIYSEMMAYGWNRI
ncbi:MULTISPECIES: GT4 family glycosyltransferase PelF [Calditerrivibrio]|uniref:GT4 family glycosyltransferase PelF n=1 Tax=Calditerrivibrio TaxID=545865 RepID=UPI003C719CD1